MPLNVPIERKCVDHNEGKNMLITICFFSPKKMCPYTKCSIVKLQAPCGGGELKCSWWVLLVFLPLILYVYIVQPKGFYLPSLPSPPS